MFWIPPLLACAVTYGVLTLILKANLNWAIDIPNNRSLHVSPTPRVGGLGICCGLVIGTASAVALGMKIPILALVLSLLLAAISLVDDLRGLPVLPRLLVHLAAACLFAWHSFGADQDVIWLLGIAISITALSNFFNFMDGANGLAGGMALIGFTVYAIALGADEPEIAVLCVTIGAAALAFLRFNLVGRTFMGDSGSIPLGFLAATFGFDGWSRGAWPIWFPAMVFAPFIVDSVVTLLRRMLRRERFWHSHRDHFYQRLAISGWSHRRLAFAEYMLMVGCGTLALIARQFGAGVQYAAIALLAAMFSILAFAVDRRWQRSRIDEQ